MQKLKQIYLDLRKVKENYEKDIRYPCIVVKSGSVTTYSYELHIDGPCKIVYNPDEPLANGSIFWIETKSIVQPQKPKKLSLWLQKNTNYLKNLPKMAKTRDEEMREAYREHKGAAKQRTIPFELSFIEWKEIWDSYWSDRKQHKYVMARYGDKGGYSFYNVRIITSKENAYEADDCYWAKRKGIKLTR